MSDKMWTKDPDEVLDYAFDWDAEYLATGETISSSTWTVTTGITVDSSTKTGTTATIWLSGGTAGSDYDIANKIATSAARTAERTAKILCRQK